MKANGGFGYIIMIALLAVFVVMCAQNSLAAELNLFMNDRELVSSQKQVLALDILSEKRKLFGTERTYGVSIDMSSSETLTIEDTVVYANDTSADPLVDFFVSLSGEQLVPGRHITQDISISTSKQNPSFSAIMLTLDMTLCYEEDNACRSVGYTVQLTPYGDLSSAENAEAGVRERRYSYDDIRDTIEEKDARVLELEELVGFDFFHLLTDEEKQELNHLLSQKNATAYENYLKDHFSLSPIKRTKKSVPLNDTDSVLEAFTNEMNQDVKRAVDTFRPVEGGTLSKETLLYRLKNEQSGKSDFVSKIVLEYTAQEDTTGFSVIEKIPKEMVDDATLLRFNIEPEILERDPIVKWSFNQVPAGKTVDLTYAIPKRVEGMESDTLLYDDSEIYSDMKVFLFVGVTAALIIVVSVWYKRRYIEQRPQKIDIQTGKHLK